MHDKYISFGCIDFENGTHAITVPVFKREKSNYIYIPKTDKLFNIIDFYEMEYIPYRLTYFGTDHLFSTKIGDKLMVPILLEGRISLIDPRWSRDQIIDNCPDLSHGALSAFISLRERLSLQIIDSYSESMSQEVQDFLSQPVRSRYWIAKFSALVNSYKEQEKIELHRAEFESARDEWIKRFSFKSSTKLLSAMLDIGPIALSEEIKLGIYLDRARHVVLQKGLSLAKTERESLVQNFPGGVLPFKHQISKSQFEYNDYALDVVAKIEDDIFASFQNGRVGKAREFNAWATDELEKILEVVQLLEGDRYTFEMALRRFDLVYRDGLAGLQTITENRHRVARAFVELDGHDSHIRQIISILDSSVSPLGRDRAKWLRMCNEVVQYQSKLAVLRRLIRPSERSLERSYLLFEGVDYTLLDTFHLAANEGDIGVFDSLIRSRSF